MWYYKKWKYLIFNLRLEEGWCCWLVSKNFWEEIIKSGESSSSSVRKNPSDFSGEGRSGNIPYLVFRSDSTEGVASLPCYRMWNLYVEVPETSKARHSVCSHVCACVSACTSIVCTEVAWSQGGCCTLGIQQVEGGGGAPLGAVLSATLFILLPQLVIHINTFRTGLL